MEESSRRPPSIGSSPSRKTFCHDMTFERSRHDSAPPILSSSIIEADAPLGEMSCCGENEYLFETDAHASLDEQHTYTSADEQQHRPRQWKRTAISALASLAATTSLLYTLRSSPNNTLTKRRMRRLKNKSIASTNTSCNSNPWHVSTNPNNFDTCTNSPDYPSDWDRADLAPLMLFNTKKKCCAALEEMMVGVSCKAVDVCAVGVTEWTASVGDWTNSPTTTTTTTTSKSGKDVNPVITTTTISTSTSMTSTTTTTTTMSSSKRVYYPSPQNNLCLSSTPQQLLNTISIQFQFNTPEECCSSYSNWGTPYQTCLSRTVQLLYDNVPTTPEPSVAPNTEYPTWSPTEYDCGVFHTVWHMNTQKLFSCTNSGIYPAEWDKESEFHLFNSAEACCLGKFPGLACSKIDICAPTSSPTKRPTVKPTRMPSRSPTMDPATTGSPTESPATYTRGLCTKGLSWHLSRSVEGMCTNDDDYPETWRHETLSRYFLSDSPEGCCEMNYFGRPGKECKIHDVCNIQPTHAPTTRRPTPKPMSTITSKPTVKPSKYPTRMPSVEDNSLPTADDATNPTKSPIKDSNSQQCGKYHPDMESQGSTTKRCTNGLNDYPSVWDEDITSQFFYETGDACCEGYWGESCDVVDLCGGDSTDNDGGAGDGDGGENDGGEGAVCGGKWHPEINKQMSCSNGLDDFPKEWPTLPESQQANVFFDSASDCCENYWKKSSCSINDHCLNDPDDEVEQEPDDSSNENDCEAHAKWHPTTTSKIKSCSNGLDDYPSAWDRLPVQQQSTIFYDSPDECCQKYWKEGCVHVDICETSEEPEDETPDESEPGDVEPEDQSPDDEDPDDESPNDEEPEDQSPDDVEVEISTTTTTTATTAAATTTSSSTTKQTQDEDCEGAHEHWHPVTSGEPNSCSRGLDDYPRAWDSLLPQQQANVMFDSADDCCQKYWKGPCNIMHSCSSSGNEGESPAQATNKPTNKPTEEDKAGPIQHDCRLWHPVITNQDEKVCSNGDDIPEAWNDLPLSQRGSLFFPSAVDCCLNHWKGPCDQDDHGCDIQDSNPGDNGSNGGGNQGGESEPEWDTSNCGRWHPTGEEGECSNGKDDYNTVWDMLPDSQKDLLFFDEADECCKSYWGELCTSVADQCKPPEPTQKPTNKPIIVNDGETAIAFGTDNFNNPSSSFPWDMGNPPEWEIVDGAMVNMPVSADDPARKTSTLSLKTSFATDAKFQCKVKVDTMMPFDWFSLRVNGKVKYPYYASSNGQWTTFGGSIKYGENLIEMVVEAGPRKPTFSRNSGLGYGSGLVWLDDCSLEQD